MKKCLFLLLITSNLAFGQSLPTPAEKEVKIEHTLFSTPAYKKNWIFLGLSGLTASKNYPKGYLSGISYGHVFSGGKLFWTFQAMMISSLCRSWVGFFGKGKCSFARGFANSLVSGLLNSHDKKPYSTLPEMESLNFQMGYVFSDTRAFRLAASAGPSWVTAGIINKEGEAFNGRQKRFGLSATVHLDLKLTQHLWLRVASYGLVAVRKPAVPYVGVSFGPVLAW